MLCFIVTLALLIIFFPSFIVDCINTLSVTGFPFDRFVHVVNSYVTRLWHHHYQHQYHLCTAILATPLIAATSYVAYIYWHSFPIDAHHIIWEFAIFMAFEGNIYCWHIFCNCLVNKCCSLLIFEGFVLYFGVCM